MCGLFPFIVMFLVTSIAMLRERTTGTLERLMSCRSPGFDLLAGYAIAFGLPATIQAVVVCVVGLRLPRASTRPTAPGWWRWRWPTRFWAWRSACC